MPKLMEKINLDLKAAMIAKNADTLSVLRMLITALHNQEIALRQGQDVELTDEQVISVISSEIKKRKEAIDLYRQGGRVDLADKEKSELETLQKYLPEQLSDQELEKIIKEIVETHGHASPSDFGRVMGQVMVKVKGRADGGKVGEIVKKMFEGEILESR